jgi:hypothetical protein
MKNKPYATSQVTDFFKVFILFLASKRQKEKKTTKHTHTHSRLFYDSVELITHHLFDFLFLVQFNRNNHADCSPTDLTQKSNEISFVNKFDASLYASTAPLSPQTSNAKHIASRLGESILLPCGPKEHELLKKLESSMPSMPVLVNWFKHYSLMRRSEKPIYAKYLANNIDYEPHISKEYEDRLSVEEKINLNITNLKATDEAFYECKLILFDKAYEDKESGSLFYLQIYGRHNFETN